MLFHLHCYLLLCSTWLLFHLSTQRLFHRCLILLLSTRRLSHLRSLICLTGFVQAHWKDDWYFGHQCLNGCNPLLLGQTHILPSNLSVTASMLHPFLPEGSSLQRELQEGRIYLLDYEVLDGVPANVVNGKQTYLLAPLCLLHLNQQSQLVPIAIQLQQNPGPQNPVFLPSDPTSDWLLAKIWVRASDFQCHQLVSYYLRTHVIGELCCVATLRQLPDLHPLHQVQQHNNNTTRTHNVLQSQLVQNVSTVWLFCGFLWLFCTTYRSLCIPDDLKDRGLDNLPQSYYTQDALKVWDALHSFVVSWVNVYDSRDDDIQLDSELQHWITDINTHGFTQLSSCSTSPLRGCSTAATVTCSVAPVHSAAVPPLLPPGLLHPNAVPPPLLPPALLHMAALPPLHTAAVPPLHSAAVPPPMLHPALLHPAAVPPPMLHPGLLHPAAVPPPMLHPGLLHLAAVPPPMLHPGLLHPAAVPPPMLNPALLHPAAVPPPMLHPGLLHPAAVPPPMLNPALLHPAAVPPPMLHPALLHPAAVPPPMLHPALLHPAAVPPPMLHPGLLHPAAVPPPLLHPALQNQAAAPPLHSGSVPPLLL
uniref:Lipoxygenase domain-containing protein n=1 Tax=Amphiprion percula TaxID=161767 RepID=A0A3P8T268_AMPPE